MYYILHKVCAVNTYGLCRHPYSISPQPRNHKYIDDAEDLNLSRTSNHAGYRMNVILRVELST